MIEPICCICSEPLKEPGALVFSPPVGKKLGQMNDDVTKYHICADCWFTLVKSFIDPASQS